MPNEDEPKHLIHSLSEVWEQIEDALDVVSPRRIVEIGSEAGPTTLRLHDWSVRHDALLISVDPDPAPVTRKLAAEAEHISVVEGFSPEALETIEAADVYVIDGDHNYWTVSAELRHIFGDPLSARLAIMHDLGWPWGRRDLYYAPERLPADAVHSYSRHGGVVVGNSGIVDGGFRGAGEFVCAEHEGGERNGVLTAVEDLLEARGDLRLIRIPCVFGVGFVFPRTALWADDLAQKLGPLDDLALLARLERNRLSLYLSLIDADDRLERERERMHALLTAAHGRIDALQADLLALKLKRANADEAADAT